MTDASGSSLPGRMASVTTAGRRLGAVAGPQHI